MAAGHGVAAIVGLVDMVRGEPGRRGAYTVPLGETKFLCIILIIAYSCLDLESYHLGKGRALIH